MLSRKYLIRVKLSFSVCLVEDPGALKIAGFYTRSARRMMRWTQPAFKRRQCASDGNVTIENELREGPLCRLHESGWISQSRFSICTE